jgi:hypothetical protein
MDIEKYIKKHASQDSEHDRAYAAALKIAYESNKNLSEKELLIRQPIVRALYAKHGNSHQNTAMCCVIYELLKEIKRA